VRVDLKAERLNRGLSLDALSEAIGVPKSTLARAESGGPQPNARNAFALADFYGFKVTEIWPLPEKASAA
jgi:transcriptional regulator with XRE-family HTH domain